MPAMRRLIGARSSEVLVAVPVMIAAIVIVVRAVTQSITIDEASAFEAFVQHGASTIWTPSAANHVLYSVLELLSTTIFGAHVLSLRLPALLGAGIYLASASVICRMLLAGTLRRFIFLCAMCLNPLILDYLVAARGYSLALGLLLAGLSVFIRMLLDSQTAGFPGGRYASLALASAALGGSVAANFSFATPAAVLGAFFLVSLATSLRPDRRTALAIVVSTAVPGLVVLWIICGYTLLHWPSGQFVYGADTMGQLLRSVVNDSLYQPNAAFLQPELLRLVRDLADAVPYVLLLATGIAAVQLTSRGRRQAVVPTRLVTLMAAATVIFTVLVHGLLRAAFGMLLPEGRTASWVIPLALVALAGAAAEESRILSGRAGRGLGLVTAGVLLLAFVNICCLRLSYFHEWRFDADTAAGYRVLAREAVRLHVLRPVVDWRFNSSLNFYREQKTDPPMQSLAGDYTYPGGRRLYVLYQPTVGDFITAHHLVTVYQGRQSGMIVAEDPGSAAGRYGRTFNP
jgi:hypothetical protein